MIFILNSEDYQIEFDREPHHKLPYRFDHISVTIQYYYFVVQIEGQTMSFTFTL